jgi:hypothetical protein
MTSSSVTPARQTHHNEPSVLACSSAITALHCGLLQICPLRVYISLEYAIRIGGGLSRLSRWISEVSAGIYLAVQGETVPQVNG